MNGPTHWPRSWDYPEEDEQEYWESADCYPEPENMTDDDWNYWLEVVAT